jgi:hypothetical protein
MHERHFRLVSEADDDYSTVCDLIQERFAHVFDTRVARRPNLALALTVSDGVSSEIAACVTLTDGKSSGFFSEQYLGERAELAVARKCACPVDRHQIVEIGGLAARGTDGSGAELVSYLPWFCLGLGYRYALVTATAIVRAILKRAGMDFVPMVEARAEALPEEERALWGRYYENNPVTGILDVVASHHATSARRKSTHKIGEMTMRVNAQKAG